MTEFKLIGRNIAIEAETTTESGIIISIDKDKNKIEVPDRVKVSYIGHQVDTVSVGEFVTLKPYSPPTGGFKKDGREFVTFDSTNIIAVYSEKQATIENNLEKEQILARAEETRLAQEVEKMKRLGLTN